ncbi:hypothetical protein BGZ74_005867 [Mortierella antarctica]|nr:hypothetical protein BGZ74_005867 [Mortierella antarctica]
MNQGWEDQNLPNECLRLVIEHFHDDPRTLRRLLYVNKFYFNAAVRQPYYNPLKHWTNHCKPGPEQNPNYSGITLKPAKFHALMLASVIHSQSAATKPSRTVTRFAPTFNVNKFLEKYGLQLPDKIELPLIQDAARGVSPTTIDYSRTESTLHPLKHNTEDCGWTSDDSDDGLDPDSYENISLSSLNEDQFLPPADRCYKLRTVNLWRWHIGQKHINQGVAFIKAIQAAFPKKPLQIKLPDDDLYNFSTGYDPDPGVGSSAAVAKRRHRIMIGNRVELHSTEPWAVRQR